MLRKGLTQDTCILLYHGISRSGAHGTLAAGDFEKQMELLSRLFTFIGINDLEKSRVGHKKQILITFDDGFHNNYQYAAPILKRLNIPAVFFVNDYHLTKGSYLWFSYLRALEGYFKGSCLEWRGKHFDFQGKRRRQSFQELRAALLDLQPHPAEMHKVILEEFPAIGSFVPDGDLLEHFAGMSPEELQDLAADDLFSIGIHTADHPFLAKCAPDEARRQIAHNITTIRTVTGKAPVAIAYPSGNYDDKTLDACKHLNIMLGFSVIPERPQWDELDIPRLGIYSASLIKMLIKVYFGYNLRILGLRIG